MVLVRVAADVMVYALSFTVFVEAISERECDAHPCSKSSGKLHFQSDPIAFRMAALADRARVLLWVGTCFAAISLAACCLTRTARMFALV